MDVKVVPLILMLLAGESLSVETPSNSEKRDHQVDIVLEKIYDKIKGIEKRLSSIDKRVSLLENQQTLSKTKAYRSLQEYSYRSGQYCGSPYSSSIGTLGQAKTACDADSTCMGFYDYGCNGNRYYLCRQGGSWNYHSACCCSYEKQGW